MQASTQYSIDLPGMKKLLSGKVREVFDLGDTLLFVATDRISAFDVVLPDPIPHKGAVLNQLSAFWFKRFEKVENHLIAANIDDFPKELQSFRAQLVGRSMIVRKTKPLPVECVVGGYLAGSGWKEYQESQSVCGEKLPAGLQLASQLPAPIFTPATKSDTGRDHAAQRGIIVADTKFEFGTIDGELLLIDECLTPDFIALLASRPIRRRRKSTQFRQTIRARLSGNARLEQDAAGAIAVLGGNRKNFRKISRSFPSPNE